MDLRKWDEREQDENKERGIGIWLIIPGYL